MGAKRPVLISLIIGFLVCSGIWAQHPSNLDSLVSVYNTKSDDTSKVYLGGLICQIVTYSDPEKVFFYGHEMISISKKMDYKFGISQGANNLGSYYLNRNELDSALYYRQMTLDIVKEVDALMGIVTANAQMGVLYTHMNDYDKAREYLNENIKLYERRDSIPNVREEDFRYIGTTYNQLAEINVKQGQYKIALSNQLRALQLYEATGEELFIADAYTALGGIEKNLGNYKQSNEYLKNSLTTYK